MKYGPGGNNEKSSVTPGFCIRQSFTLFEELAEAAQGWELGFRQLSATSSPFRLEQLATSRMVYARISFDSKFHQLGGPVLGFRTFALHVSGGTDYRWCGGAVTNQDLIVFPADGEFESVSLPGFDVFTLSLSTALLERTAEIQFQRSLHSYMDSSGYICRLAGVEVRKLRALLHRLSEDIKHFYGDGTMFSQNSRTQRLEQRLAHQVLACLGQGRALAPQGAGSKRMKTFDKALAFIEQRLNLDVSALDIAESVGVSRRTLEYAFRDGFDMSPAAYLKAMRLRTLNQKLLNGNHADTSVAQLCADLGFLHPGQAAADYLAMYEELPSFTLRRSR